MLNSQLCPVRTSHPSIFSIADIGSPRSVYLQARHRFGSLRRHVYIVGTSRLHPHAYKIRRGTNSIFRVRSSSGFIFWSSLFYIPQFFQVALGYSPIRAGVFLLPVLVSQTAASFISVSFMTNSNHFFVEPDSLSRESLLVELDGSECVSCRAGKSSTAHVASTLV